MSFMRKQSCWPRRSWLKYEMTLDDPIATISGGGELQQKTRHEARCGMWCGLIEERL
jgi:hypothetical protein